METCLKEAFCKKKRGNINEEKHGKCFLTIVTALLAVVLVACGQGTASKDNKEAETQKNLTLS